MQKGYLDMVHLNSFYKDGCDILLWRYGGLQVAADGRHTHKLILFGSGIFAQRFLDLYRQDYPLYTIVDNSKEKWGQTVSRIEIQSPEILRQLQSGEYKVLICIKNYLSVMKQFPD